MSIFEKLPRLWWVLFFSSFYQFERSLFILLLQCKILGFVACFSSGVDFMEPEEKRDGTNL